MLAAPPHLPILNVGVRSYVQIAWPTANIVDDRGEFRGFMMPEVDFQVSTELENILQRSARQRKRLPEFYGARVLLAANLAALMAEMHKLGHYMVDMKPMNMRFYPDTWYLAILDTDGFSINGTRRLPARQFSDEYIAPEAYGRKPEQLGLEHDLFALGVIIFRLLNNGIHPYQGIDMGSIQHPTTLQERIFAGLYSYGQIPHSGVGPAPSSIHDFLEGKTRDLFDRCFRIGGGRPTAEKWRDHLNGLITEKTLLKCAVNPIDHAHFSKGCGLCVLEQRLSTARAAVAQQPIQSPGSVLGNLSTGAPGGRSLPPRFNFRLAQQPALAITPGPKKRRRGLRYLAIIVVALGLYANQSPKAPRVEPNQAQKQIIINPVSAPLVVNPVLQSPAAPPVPQPMKPPPIAQTSYDGKHPATIQYHGLMVTVDGSRGPDGDTLGPVATGWYQGRPAFTLQIDDGVQGANLELRQLDRNVSLPQVIFTAYSGGAHCCTVTKIATINSSGSWTTLDVGQNDGGGYKFLDLDGNGNSALVTIDNSFLYAFAPYSCSYAPTRIMKLIGSEVKDLTRDLKYREFLRQELLKMETFQRNNPCSEPNGYLAGWVAQKALVGELDDAWHTMLASFDRNSDWLVGCRSGAPSYNCPDNEKYIIAFPEGLANHLFENGYISETQRNNLSLVLAQPSSPAPPVPSNPAFTQGVAERQAYEAWFAALEPATQGGAAYWAENRSRAAKGENVSCSPPGASWLWMQGCRGAMQTLSGSDKRRLADADYRAGWNSVPDPAPDLQTLHVRQQSPEQFSSQPSSPAPPVPSNPAFTQGVAERQAYEAWFAALEPTTQGGAAYWAENRSRAAKGENVSCSPPGASWLWMQGCRGAMQTLSRSDKRRLADADYRAGWNSVPDPAPAP